VIRRDRLERAEKLEVAEARLAAGKTQRQVAEELGVARSTLQDWRRASSLDGVPEALAAFTATPEGVRWLQRMLLAAQFAITLRGGAGVRVVCEFLQLSGLSAFVGASYGSQQKLNSALEKAVVALAEEQRTVLAEGMAPRQVTVCEDETFHPETCLVALEPVSNFILLEQYAQDRSAATWTQALQQAIAELPVEVIQGTSDEAKALRRHIEKECNGHHSPDLFHCAA
jgi:transposase-like protein